MHEWNVKGCGKVNKSRRLPNCFSLENSVGPYKQFVINAFLNMQVRMFYLFSQESKRWPSTLIGHLTIIRYNWMKTGFIAMFCTSVLTFVIWCFDLNSGSWIREHQYVVRSLGIVTWKKKFTFWVSFKFPEWTLYNLHFR